MDKTLSYFVYSPPKSNSHGHGIRDKNVKRAVQRYVNSFVNSFNAIAIRELLVTLRYDRRNEIEHQNAQVIIEKLDDFLGTSNKDLGSTITWQNKEKDILDILEYLEQIKSENLLPLSRFTISYSYNYGQSPDPYGYTMCSIESGRLFVRLHLILPFTIDDERTYELLSKFQGGLPFKLNSKHFRRLGPSKNGYNQWKLDEETQKRLDECLNVAYTLRNK